MKMKTQEWYYQLMGETQGPVTRENLSRLAASNKISRDTFVRCAHQDWTTADRIEGLFQPIFSSSAASEDFYYQVMGEIRGPLGPSALKRLAERRVIGRDTFVRRNNEDWVRVEQMMDLLL